MSLVISFASPSFYTLRHQVVSKLDESIDLREIRIKKKKQIILSKDATFFRRDQNDAI